MLQHLELDPAERETLQTVVDAFNAAPGEFAYVFVPTGTPPKTEAELLAWLVANAETDGVAERLESFVQQWGDFLGLKLNLKGFLKDVPKLVGQSLLTPVRVLTGGNKGNVVKADGSNLSSGAGKLITKVQNVTSAIGSKLADTLSGGAVSTAQGLGTGISRPGANSAEGIATAQAAQAEAQAAQQQRPPVAQTARPTGLTVRVEEGMSTGAKIAIGVGIAVAVVLAAVGIKMAVSK